MLMRGCQPWTWSGRVIAGGAAFPLTGNAWCQSSKTYVKSLLPFNRARYIEKLSRLSVQYVTLQTTQRNGQRCRFPMFDIRKWPSLKLHTTLVYTTPWRTEILQLPQGPPAQESTCTGPSEVCQWFRGELGERVVVRWDQNPALWHKLNSPCLEEEECCQWPQEHHPHSQTWRWKHYALGCFSAKGTGQLHRIKGTMDGTMYRQGQGIENGSWMGIPAWQWPKTHGQGNKWVAQEEAH